MSLEKLRTYTVYDVQIDYLEHITMYLEAFAIGYSEHGVEDPSTVGNLQHELRRQRRINCTIM